MQNGDIYGNKTIWKVNYTKKKGTYIKRENRKSMDKRYLYNIYIYGKIITQREKMGNNKRTYIK